LEHKFAVGQMVELTPNALLVAAAGQYEIRQRMPLSDISSDSPRYRIKSIAESYERVAREHELTLSTSPTLITLC
jgi:hypothetical protein